MDTLIVTVVGQDLFKIVEEKFENVELTYANRINPGMLGNLKISTYEFDLEECEIIRIRKELLCEISEDRNRMTAFFEAGNWMRLIVIKPLRI